MIQKLTDGLFSSDAYILRKEFVMWLYNGKEITDEETEGYVAFVYLITNLETGKRYIGKKLLTKTRRKPVKGKKRKKKVVSASDWRDYFGSNITLIADRDRLGPEKFRREILKLCESKGTANYWEARYQVDFRVLESDEWYNDWIFVKVHRSHIKS